MRAIRNFRHANLSSQNPCQKVIQMSSFTAVVHKEEDMYVAECPEVGTVSQGKTLEKAVHILREATELYLEEFPIEEKERSCNF